MQLDPRYYAGGTFVIETTNNSKQNKYIQSHTDGKPLGDSGSISGADLMEENWCCMGYWFNKEWGSQPEDAPPSMSDEEK